MLEKNGNALFFYAQPKKVQTTSLQFQKGKEHNHLLHRLI